MPSDAERYCKKSDLLLGDVSYGDSLINAELANTADDIDSVLGVDYVLPLNFPSMAVHTQLILKKLARLITSGRIILSRASHTEGDSTHAYGTSLLREGQSILAAIANGMILLNGATRINDGSTGNGPSILNVDAESYVEAFYNGGLNVGVGRYW